MIKLSQPSFTEEQITSVVEVLKSGMLVQGKKVLQFEELLSDYMNGPYVVAVSSGTAALHLAMIALGISKGDAVFVPDFTFPATANAVELVGARSIMVEVDPSTYCITPETLLAAIKGFEGPEKPKAIIPVHEFGAGVAMDQVMDIAREHGLFVVEDAACALGTQINGRFAGDFGHMGCFSFHPRKSLTTGEGGAITTNDKSLYLELLKLRNHGIEYSNQSIDFVVPGLNYRMTEFQAALGITQVEYFKRMLNIRFEIAQQYQQLLKDIEMFQLPENLDGHSWQTFMIVLNEEYDRRTIINELKSREIETNLGAQALHMLSYFKQKYAYHENDFSVAARLFKHGLAIPIHDKLTASEINKVSEQLVRVLRSIE
ncbi:DegT/DnrJ/EryC1/StrS family aminotransferase [Paenibacillus koleovorans]|uniref:DegT/DnrJ/EryC1/StrS family aminotransferase n=1 Tax=Paenibacillus koleovorans TaxID=121608 RepID=UPI000FDCCC17|nr:DegT/DnrJ/EryC1/StrS family aminotransferase [Paenibacillus koleovorans]